MPRVSIIMATYNRAALLPKAVESVRAQTFRDWELIVIDDASSDDTPEVLAALKKNEPRLAAVLRNDQNLGISKTYNKGFRAAKGEYIAMIDDDDAWIPEDKLEEQVKFLDGNPECAGCGGGVVVVDASGRELYRYLKPRDDGEIRRYMLYSNPMANSTTVFRRQAAERAGWYDESIRYSGDRDFWLKMGLQGKLYNFPLYFSYYTMSDKSTSIARIKPHLKTSLAVMRRYKGKYPGYAGALLVNELQYAYAYLPERLRKSVHSTAARLKRLIFK